MSAAWGDAGLLIELLDRQFEYMLSLEGTAQLLRLHRLLQFIQQDSRLTGVLDDFRIEAEFEIRAYRRTDQSIRRRLESLWNCHAQVFRVGAERAAERGVQPFGRADEFLDLIAERPAIAFPTLNENVTRAEHTRRRIAALQHWRSYAASGGGPEDEGLARLDTELRHLATRLDHAATLLAGRGLTLAWPSYLRLRDAATALNPAPPSQKAGVLAHVRYGKAKERETRLRALHPVSPGSFRVQSPLTSDIENVPVDAKLLHQELRHRIGLGRSRLATVERYAARCASFDAKEMRARCAEDSRNAERELTLHFARYLFDQGLNPLLDPTISGLRPDVMHLGVGEPLYVEAKQYTASPESTLRKAYDQVWSTWLNLRQHHPSVTEAFLVVFRREGPLVHLPATLRHEGLKLHSVLVDISEARGSRETERGIHLTTSDLLPTPATSRSHAP